MTRRLLASYLLITALVLVVLEVPLGLFFQQGELDRLTADTERDATVLITAYEDDLEARAPVDPGPAQRYTVQTGVRVVVVDRLGAAVVDTGNETGRDFSTRPEFMAALAGDRATGTRFSTDLDTELLYVALPVASGGVVHGAIRLTLDTEQVTARIQRFWWGLAGIAALVLAMVIAVGWATARSISRPILQLQETALRFSGGDLSVAEPIVGAPPEIERLDEAMTTMARRLDRLLSQQRSFVADASHQLRTPLTALRLRLENLEATTADQNVGDEIAATIDETDRLTALVNDLLQLATAERPSIPMTVPIVDIVAERVGTWTALAEQSNVVLSLATHCGEHTTAVAVPGAIEQMLDNLIDNAIAAIDSGRPPVDPAAVDPAAVDPAAVDPARVSVVIAADPSSVSLQVVDDGPGLDPGDRLHAFERFWRGAAPAAGPRPPGSGLGLSIVKGLADASGATVALGSNTDGGLTVTVVFRRAVDRT